MNLVAVLVMFGASVGLAVAIRALHRRSRRTPSGPFTHGTHSTDVINMARIRVSGVGGLGLVAMALVVAWGVPRIGQTLALGAAAGVLLATLLILRRRSAGPLPSSGRRPGASTTLAIEDPEPREVQAPIEPPSRRVLGAVHPAKAV